MNSKTTYRILLEGILIGIICLGLFKIINYFLQTEKNIYISVFLTSFLIHILFELFGINIWYSKEYVNILNNK
jgi:hypothetical protein